VFQLDNNTGVKTQGVKSSFFTLTAGSVNNERAVAQI
jgi:hypothetical protein